MKSRFLIAFAAVVALASVSAYAQTSMRVSVPFEFTVGRTVLPAGEYIVQGNTSLGGASLQTAHAGPGAYALAVPAVRNNAQDQPTLRKQLLPGERLVGSFHARAGVPKNQDRNRSRKNRGRPPA